MIGYCAAEMAQIDNLSLSSLPIRSFKLKRCRISNIPLDGLFCNFSHITLGNRSAKIKRLKQGLFRSAFYVANGNGARV